MSEQAVLVVRIHPVYGDGRTGEGWGYRMDRASGGAYATPEQAFEAAQRNVEINRHSYGNPELVMEKGRYISVWVPDDIVDTDAQKGYTDAHD